MGTGPGGSAPEGEMEEENKDEKEEKEEEKEEDLSSSTTCWALQPLAPVPRNVGFSLIPCPKGCSSPCPMDVGFPVPRDVGFSLNPCPKGFGIPPHSLSQGI